MAASISIGPARLARLQTNDTMSDVAIRVENLSKVYQLGSAKAGSLVDTFKGLGSSKEPKGEFWALKDVGFEINRGEALGIIGKNGAGKSTLLKIISRITEPTTGRIEINGRLSSLLEVGTGFHPDLSGRENIFLNGTILGMSRREIRDKFDDIVDFSGISQFIDTPVKRYSSGMYVRLAFAVAAFLEPDIMIVDEVLAVGDVEFQRKCLGKMNEAAGSGRTVIFVSHSISAINALCTRGLFMEHGQLKYEGTVRDCVKRYLNLGEKSDSRDVDLVGHKGRSGKDTFLTRLRLLPGSEFYDFGQEMEFVIDYNFPERIQTPQFVLAVSNELGQKMFTLHSTYQPNNVPESLVGSGSVRVKVPHNYLLPGNNYNVDLLFWKPGFLLDEVLGAMSFSVQYSAEAVQDPHRWDHNRGAFYVPTEWIMGQ